MKKIRVHLKDKAYDILIGRNLLSSSGRFMKPLKTGSKVLIVSNKKISKLFLNPVQKSLKRSGFQVHTYLLPFGNERDKSSEVLRKIWNEMSHIPLDRTSAVIALGGGVVGDVVGFAASTYMRGLGVIQIPTTLLAQVDSAIGGKTAIDLPTAKNIVGSFHQPRLVLADLEALKYLRPFDVKNQFAEIIKYGIIADTFLFRLLENRLGRFLSAVEINRFSSTEFKFLEAVVSRSAAIKARVVAEDERETKGKRMILNYGHTFAHALEGASKFRLPHGQAVAIGMIFAGELACRMKVFSRAAQNRQIQLIAKLGLSLDCKFKSAELIQFMRRDKKVKNGKMRFILPKRIGQVGIYDSIPERLVRGVLDDYRRK